MLLILLLLLLLLLLLPLPLLLLLLLLLLLFLLLPFLVAIGAIVALVVRKNQVTVDEVVLESC